MIERSDANIQLMESLFDSAIPDLIHANEQAQREFTRMHLKGRTDESDMDLQLTPSFLRNPDGTIVDTKQQNEIGNEVLAGLHEAWKGTDKVEHQPNPGFTERYWEFTDSEDIPYTVVEMYGKFGLKDGAEVRGYILRGKRPKAFQDLLDKNLQAEHADEQEKPAASNEVLDEPKVKRRQKVGKAITKWWKDQANQPPQRGRL